MPCIFMKVSKESGLKALENSVHGFYGHILSLTNCKVTNCTVTNVCIPNKILVHLYGDDGITNIEPKL